MTWCASPLPATVHGVGHACVRFGFGVNAVRRRQRGSQLVTQRLSLLAGQHAVVAVAFIAERDLKLAAVVQVSVRSIIVAHPILWQITFPDVERRYHPAGTAQTSGVDML